ncbi:CPBP family intramembrane glutamic endopeptidase [Treponema pedis]|uniref:CAAX prenyl protease 2/Lysostaphin resistance protein A-like domain-containing protein n=3 Tax=Treponema pedis TaxID=409322 RepID=S6A8B6_9SPIR|nr:CPBP family intramembrane glutamic endopeptidase [Treponema pedis]AGT43544.1 hypothetical protein TPE_1048 [Treponema pedis str. T A4]QOW61085.1 CPBP family intramembrane metalloprotease [Treponema pedis]
MPEKSLNGYNLKLKPDYIQLLQSEGFSKKRVVAALSAYILVYFILIAIFFIIIEVILKISGNSNTFSQFLNFDTEDFPFSDKFTDIILFLLFPTGMITNKIVFKKKAGNLISVFGKFRLSWFFICLAVLTPIAAVCIIGQTFLDGIPEFIFSKSTLFAVFLTLLFTPLQCAGEEMLFRGWGLQVFGIMFKNKNTAWILMSFTLSLLFSIAHFPANIWVGLELFVSAILWCALIYITGGMEAGIILHSLNNLFLGIISDLTAGEMTFDASDIEAGFSREGAALSISGDIVMFIAVILLWKKIQKYAKS